MMTIFTPSFADEANTNAQNLTVKEIVARLCPDKFRVLMCYQDAPDPRIASRKNTTLVKWVRHGNTLRLLLRCLRDVPDIYFYPREGPLDRAFFFLRRHLGLRTAVVTHVVSGGLDREPPRATLARCLRESDAVFANSRHVAHSVSRLLGVPAGTIHNGIDRRFFFPPNGEKVQRGSSGDRLTVLYAGSFRFYKRVDLVVRQAARWPHVQFRIAGQGEEEEACRRLAEQLGCSNVEFLGHISLEPLGREMRQADVFLFPSVLEGHPQVLGQAAACGLPCVAMNVYQPDYVRDGETGFLAASDEELAQKLDLLLRQPDLRRSLSAAAVAHARQFDWDQATRQWQEAFEAILSRRQRH